MLVHGLQPDCHVPRAFGGVRGPLCEVRLRFAKDKARRLAADMNTARTRAPTANGRR